MSKLVVQGEHPTRSPIERQNAKVSKHSFELDRVRVPTAMIDKWSFLPILAFVYASIVGPLIAFVSPTATMQSALQSAIEGQLANRIFWPAMAASSVVLVMRNRSRIGKLILPPHITCLLAFLAFAGASALWAFKPQLSFIRFTQEAMFLTSIILPTMLAPRTSDVMRGLFLCFGIGLILNVLLGTANGGGYFLDKNALGKFAAIAFLLALHEVSYRGLRRALGMIVLVIGGIVLFLTNSKTSMGFAFLAPLLAGLALMTRKMMRISPAIVVFITITLLVFFRDQVGWLVFQDQTFSARTIIWDFVFYEIGRRPLLGWGYHSFWLVGPDAPSIVEASGWVKLMPNAHNGYLDTMLELGPVGLALLVIVIMTTLHAIGRVANRDPARAWVMLSLAIFFIFHNLLESAWMHGSELGWMTFALVAAETGRCWRLCQPTKVTHGDRKSVV